MSTVGQAVPAAITLARLGELGEALAKDSGESVAIHRLAGGLASSGLLFKEYRKTAVQDGRNTSLEPLIAFGRGTAAAGAAERELLLRASSWPVAAVSDERGELIGCLIPEADKRFRSKDGKLREIDTLAQTDEKLAGRGISVPPEQRRAVSRAVVQVAAALDRRRLVYSDWNYANTLWCPDDSSVFVIDIDGCRPARMPNIFQSDWEDPLTNGSMPADTFTDRYRVALLTARCLTGCRDLPSVIYALSDAGDGTIPGRSILLDILRAADRSTRPSARSLLAALEGADLRFAVRHLPMPARPTQVRRRAPAVLKTDLTVLPKNAATEPAIPAEPGTPAKRSANYALAVFVFLVVLFAVIAVIALTHHH